MTPPSLPPTPSPHLHPPHHCCNCNCKSCCPEWQVVRLRCHLVSGRCGGGRWRWRVEEAPLSLPRPRSPSNSTSLLMWHCCRHTGRRSMHTHPCTPLPPTLPAHRSHTYTPWYPFSRLAATRNTSSGMCAWSWEGAWGCSTGRMGCTQRLHVAGGGCVHRDRQAGYAPAALLQLRKAMTKECEGAQGIGKRSNPGVWVGGLGDQGPARQQGNGRLQAAPTHNQALSHHIKRGWEGAWSHRQTEQG